MYCLWKTKKIGTFNKLATDFILYKEKAFAKIFFFKVMASYISHNIHILILRLPVTNEYMDPEPLKAIAVKAQRAELRLWLQQQLSTTF